MIHQKILKGFGKKIKDEKVPEVVVPFKFKSIKKHQFITFFKPETFIDKTPAQLEKIMDLVFKKFEDYGVGIDGAAMFAGPALERYKIMDRHYGAINHLSKNASKISDDDKKLVHEKLNLTGKKLKILGGHEAFEISGINSTDEFDKMWLATPSTKIKSGFYAKVMTIASEEIVVVNGFHPQQLAYYTAAGRKLGLMLVSSDKPWKDIREQMLGDTFPNKAHPESIRGTLYAQSKDYGFDSVTQVNNVLHISAGPTESLFEMNNFFKEPFGVDIIKERVNLVEKLLAEGLTEAQVLSVFDNKELHGMLEHKDADEAVEVIKSKYNLTTT